MNSASREPVPHEDRSRLILAVASGRDRECFTRLFEYFAPRVKSYLLRLGAQPVFAEELAQETMLVVWRKAASFDPSRATASTWIFTIARNLHIDSRRRIRAPEFFADDPADAAPPPAEPARLLLDGERETRVREALNELSPDQAAVIRLSFFEDKPHAEIARQLSLPLGTVKSRLRLAMNHLRNCLGDLL